MASNPMQRKIRNSFLLGILVTLLIAGVVIVFLLLSIKQKDEEIQTITAARRSVFVLNKDVKAGEILTQDMFDNREIQVDSIPAEAVDITYDDITSWGLQTKEGEVVCRDTWGLYLDRSMDGQVSDTIMEIYENTGNEFLDSNGKKVEKGNNYVTSGGIIEKIDSVSDAKKDEYGMFLVDSEGKNDKEVRVYQEATTGEFYTFKIDTSVLNTAGSVTRIKEYIDIKDVPVLAKIDMNANTVITKQFVVQSDEQVTDDTRQEEYNVVVLPMDLMTGDYIDVRLMAPNGQNFIVVSKAQVEIPMNADGTYVADTIKLNLREDEILTMSSAIIEAAGLNGAKLYATRYVEPAMQEGSAVTYTPNSAVTKQLQAYMTTDMNGDGKITSDDYINLVKDAENILKVRYSESAKKIRNEYLQQYIDSVTPEEFKGNVEAGLEESIGTSLTTRQQYLESLGY